MARTPGKMYRKITQQAYTRREFMGGVPANRITQYHSGNPRTVFPIQLDLIPEERGQIRHSALEAMRITAVRHLDKRVGRDNYHLHVRIYPHHVLRQNKQASGAGADRVSMGMRLAFGKPIGTAARIERGQVIVSVRTVAKAIPHAKEAMRKCYSKIAMPCHVDLKILDATLSVSEVMAEAAKGAKMAYLPGAGVVVEETAPVEGEAAPAEGEAAPAEGEAAEGEKGGKPGKPGEKPTGKPGEKPSGKPGEKPAGKPGEKAPAGKPGEKPAGKAGDKGKDAKPAGKKA